MPSGRDQRYLALRTGLAAAAAITGATFSRGLLPRSLSDQAMATGAAAACGLGVGTFAVSAVEATAELVTTTRGHGDPETATLVAATLLGVAGVSASKLLSNSPRTPIPVAGAASAAWVLGAGSGIAAAVIATDRGLRKITRGTGPALGIGLAATLGGLGAVVRVRQTEARAAQYGEDVSLLPATGSTSNALKSIGLGAAVGAGLLGMAGAEFALAEGSTRLVSAALGRRDDPVTPLVGHTIAASTMAPAGVWALDQLRRRVMHADDVVEPAYPDPPSSRFVTAGPASLVSFGDIGKEGRRFVLMALTAEEISEVMGEPAIEPIRAVAGYTSAATPQARADLALAELEALGAHDRSVIVVAAPTGVGYVNYSFAEALEYLTRGDCAILVPQYALVPSALALNQTRAGVELQTLILAGIRDRIAALPPLQRPRLLQFGESLGAQVALDVAATGTEAFGQLGVEAGLYLGTPFRTKLWDAWFDDPRAADPAGVLGSVTRADRIPELPARVRHVQVIHDDDPINKFTYDAVIREPWWMGPPEQRPPLVPKETQFRPIVTFLLNLVDLKNGMNSKPGEFVRRGHDYRIELCDAIRHTYRLPADSDQVERIESALRDHEREWAARRMVARRFDSARAAVVEQLNRWGVDPKAAGLDQATMSRLARGEIAQIVSRLGISSPPG